MRSKYSRYWLPLVILIATSCASSIVGEYWSVPDRSSLFSSSINLYKDCTFHYQSSGDTEHSNRICEGTWSYSSGEIRLTAIPKPCGEMFTGEYDVVGIEKAVDPGLLKGRLLSPYILSGTDTAYFTGATVLSNGGKQIVGVSEPVLLGAEADTIEIFDGLLGPSRMPSRILVFALGDNRYNAHRIYIKPRFKPLFTMEEPPFEKLSIRNDNLYFKDELMFKRKQ